MLSFNSHSISPENCPALANTFYSFICTLTTPFDFGNCLISKDQSYVFDNESDAVV